MKVISTRYPDLVYYPETGCLWWGKNANRRSRGKIAGFVRLKSGGLWRWYVGRFPDQKMKLATRIIWEMCHGTIPKGMVIDHINGDSLDDRLCNLRCVTHLVSAKNRILKTCGYGLGIGRVRGRRIKNLRFVSYRLQVRRNGAGIDLGESSNWRELFPLKLELFTKEELLLRSIPPSNPKALKFWCELLDERGLPHKRGQLLDSRELDEMLKHQ